MTASPRRNGAAPRVLVVESDEAYQAVIATCVGLAACQSNAVSHVDAGISKLEEGSYDLVIWGVPSDEALQADVIARFRQHGQMPVLVIDDHFESAQLSFESGAAHVLPKPFIPGALVGAIKASLRQVPSMLTDLVSRMDIRGMVFEGRALHYKEHEIDFTRREWELLAILLGNPNRFLGVSEILQLGWHAGDREADQVRTYVSRLRKKLDPLDLPCRIVSQQGRGYCLLID
jgi:two-component system response regulator PrrA